MKNVALLPSHLEPGQYTLAQRFEQAGFRIFWITHTTFDRLWLIRLGAPADRILDTTLPDSLQMTEAEIDACLLRLEAGAAPFINDIIEMDRRLKHKSYAFARAYLAHIEKVLTDFLTRNAIRYVSNGRDTALHLACHKICQRLGIPSVVPTIMRIPDNRFGFCVGYREAEFVRLGAPDRDDFDEARRLVKQFREKKTLSETSQFERRNSRYLRRLIPDLKRFLTLAYRASHRPGDDVGRYSMPQLLKMFLRKRINALHLKAAPVWEPRGNRPYVLYGLQMQPESSIDVLASFVSNQTNLIALIAKSTPCTHEVYVKPHPEYVGGVARGHLLAIKRIPGVRLVSPFLSSHQLIMQAAVVLTPTGTMAMESAFFGVPSVIFAEEFFRGLPSVNYCANPNELPKLIPKLIATGRREVFDSVVDFVADYLARSFPGRVTNYLGPYTEEELASLVHAYSIVYDYLNDPQRAGSCSEEVLA